MEIVIRLVDGRLQLGGNVTDKVMALGMLELAKVLMAQQPATASGGGVSIPSPAAQKVLIGQNSRAG